MTDFLKIAKSIVVHFAHICAYGVETVNFAIQHKLWTLYNLLNLLCNIERLCRQIVSARILTFFIKHISSLVRYICNYPARAA